MNRLRKCLWIVLILGFGCELAAQENSQRVSVEPRPTPLVAGYPSYFQIQVSQLLTSADPLLGSEVPTTSQVTAEILSADGNQLLAGPLLVPSQTGNPGIFGISHVFDLPGNYLLGLGLHNADGTTEWHQVDVMVSADPYGWVGTGFWILLAALSVPVVIGSWRKAVPIRRKRVQALILAAVLLGLIALLLHQYLAPSVRHHLLGSAGQQPSSLSFTPTSEADAAGSTPQVLRLDSQLKSYSGSASFFPELQPGQPAVITVSITDENGRRVAGRLAGYLRLEANQEAVPLADSTSRNHDAVHTGHEMVSSGASDTLQLSFREQPSGVYNGTLLPLQEGDYGLELHFQAPSLHLMLNSSSAIRVGRNAAGHSAHGPLPSSDSIPTAALAYVAAALAVLGALASVLLLRRKWSDGAWSFDLFVWKPLYGFVRSKYFQPTLWTPNLIVFALVIYLGIWDVPVGGRNLATKLTWTIWWAAIIFAFVFAGKIWCAMCPFGALTTWTSRAFSPQRKLPRVLRNIWIANIAFFFVTWADDFWGIVATPLYTSLLVILVAIAAIAVGYFFERATFCRHICPIGGLIGLYSMFSGLELRAKNREVCRLCVGKECYAGTPALPGCPMMQFPSSLDRNNYCNLCGDCIKACPHQNLALQVRPFARDIWKSSRRHMDEAFLAIALVGLTVVVTGHMVEPWHAWMDYVASWVPWHALGVESHVAIEKTTFTLVYGAGVLLIAPLLLLAAAALATLLTRGKVAVRAAFQTYAYMFIPVGIALHLAHNLLHLLKEGSGIVPVIRRTFAKYTPVNLGVPDWGMPPLASDSIIYWLQMTVLVTFYIASIYLGCRIALKSCPDRKTALRTITPMVALSFVFTLLNIFLLSQPMAARHHH
ncbi:MAG: 4Fe-4S binding protein [Acidobacteria bacterium]|nr:4Fe-4S binding protein [Acidobacteriota bacterium]